ncbi:MAG: hypothetical protein OES26_11125 [Gammaproteobacteria bacterium]|nr:hypothetical protein [Gammaproteobacteria bacterium]
MDIESYIDKIRMFMEEGNYHAAFNIAISGINKGRSINDQSSIDQFVGLIKAITVIVATEYGSKDYLQKDNPDEIACFICGATKDDLKLLLGTNGAICENCSERAYMHFHKDDL